MDTNHVKRVLDTRRDIRESDIVWITRIAEKLFKMYRDTSGNSENMSDRMLTELSLGLALDIPPSQFMRVALAGHPTSGASHPTSSPAAPEDQ
jgi:hypothetical protein